MLFWRFENTAFEKVIVFFSLLLISFELPLNFITEATYVPLCGITWGVIEAAYSSALDQTLCALHLQRISQEYVFFSILLELSPPGLHCELLHF